MLKLQVHDLPDVLRSVMHALQAVDPEYCRLSGLDYSSASPEVLHATKYQERVLAYEFYHCLRTKMTREQLPWSGTLQAEVSKRYQHLFATPYNPDFLIHQPDSTQGNLLALEFKLASRPASEHYEDLAKLARYAQAPLSYAAVALVIPGFSIDLHSVLTILEAFPAAPTSVIYCLLWNLDTRGVDAFSLRAT